MLEINHKIKAFPLHQIYLVLLARPYTALNPWPTIHSSGDLCLESHMLQSLHGSQIILAGALKLMVLQTNSIKVVELCWWSQKNTICGNWLSAISYSLLSFGMIRQILSVMYDYKLRSDKTVIVEMTRKQQKFEWPHSHPSSEWRVV